MQLTKSYPSLFILALAVSCNSSVDNAIDSDGGGNSMSEGSDASGEIDAAISSVFVNPIASEWHGECEQFAEQTDYRWDINSEVAITLGDDNITATSAEVVVEGSKATITAAGSYRLSGSLTDGSIFVNAADDDMVRLILDNAHLASSQDSPLYIVNDKKTIIILADGSQNSIADSSNYSTASETNAALYSKANLAIAGTGSLTVNGNYQDGITSKDGLIIASGTIIVNAVDDGIRGKDCLIVQDGDFSVQSGGDGLKSDNEGDAELGYVSLKAGMFNIEANGDAIAASTTVYVTQGKFRLVSGGGSGQTVSDDSSSKGIKGAAGLVVDDGEFELDSADDALHTDGIIYLNGGFFEIASGDDGIHSDGSVEIDGPTINISKSYEGIEGVTITIYDGNIHIASSDDGINASDGSGARADMPLAMDNAVIPSDTGEDSFGSSEEIESGIIFPPAMESGPRPPGPMGSPSMPAEGSMTNENLLVTINGGKLVIDAYGDGLDSNGSMKMTGGTVLVSGPVENMNGAIDMGDCSSCGLEISGGFLVAAGSAGMAETPDATSSQNAVHITTGSISGGGGPINFGPGAVTAEFAAGTLVHIENASGESLLTYAPAKPYASLVFSSPDLIDGSYTVYTGGTCTGAVTDNLYEGGSYQNGAQKTTLTIDSNTTVVAAQWTL